MGTYVERPVLDREATVHTADFEYWASEDLRVSGALMNSKVNGEDGYGFRVGYGYTPSKTFSGGLGVWYFDEEIDLSDMGCYSLTPMDFILQGIPVEEFESETQFASNENLEKFLYN